MGTDSDQTVTSTCFGASNRPDGRPLAIRRACPPNQRRTIATPSAPRCGRPTQASARRRHARRRLRPADGTPDAGFGQQKARQGASAHCHAARPGAQPLTRFGGDGARRPEPTERTPAALRRCRHPGVLRVPRVTVCCTARSPTSGLGRNDVSPLRRGRIPQTANPGFGPGRPEAGTLSGLRLTQRDLSRRLSISTTRAHQPLTRFGGDGASPAENRRQPELFGAPTRPGDPTGAPAPQPLTRFGGDGARSTGAASHPPPLRKWWTSPPDRADPHLFGSGARPDASRAQPLRRPDEACTALSPAPARRPQPPRRPSKASTQARARPPSSEGSPADGPDTGPTSSEAKPQREPSPRRIDGPPPGGPDARRPRSQTRLALGRTEDSSGIRSQTRLALGRTEDSSGRCRQTRLALGRTEDSSNTSPPGAARPRAG